MSAVSVLIAIGIYLVIFAIVSFPLFRVVKALKGTTTLAEVIVVNLFGAVLVSLSNSLVFIWTGKNWIGLVSFIVLLFIYKVVFQVKWGTALGIWLISLIMTAILIFATLLIEFSIGLSSMII